MVQSVVVSNKDEVFPKLMVSSIDDIIVLFTNPKVGCVMGNPTNVHQLLYWSNHWDMPSFHDFKGIIKLSNSNE